MTCIVGLVDSETRAVYIGADSQATQGWTRSHRADPKVFVLENTPMGDIIIGVTGSPRANQLLRYAFVVPENKHAKPLLSYLVTDFVDAVRDCFKKGGLAQEKDEVESMNGNAFLVGIQGELFEIEDDFQLSKVEEGFDAIGCADDAALGALYALRTIKIPPVAKLKIALQAAEHYNIGVCAPFRVESVGAPKTKSEIPEEHAP